MDDTEKRMAIFAIFFCGFEIIQFGLGLINPWLMYVFYFMGDLNFNKGFPQMVHAKSSIIYWLFRIGMPLYCIIALFFTCKGNFRLRRFNEKNN